MCDSRISAKTETALAGTSAKWIRAVIAAVAISFFCATASISGFAHIAYAEEANTEQTVTETADDYTYEEEPTFNPDGSYGELEIFLWPLYFDDSLISPVGVEQGKKLKLKPHLVNTYAKTLVWSSSKPNIATVTSKGVVKTKKPGKTKITVKNKYRSSDYAKVTIEVYKKPVKSKVYKKIMKLKSKYREGKAWGNNKSYYWK